MSTLKAELLRFVAGLRAAGVRISVAESIDAMNAVAAAGIGRARMREALSAALIKDEADRPLFERAFTGFFKPVREPAARAGRPAGDHPAAAPGPGLSAGESFRAGPAAEEPRPDEPAERRKPAAGRRSEGRAGGREERAEERKSEQGESERHRGESGEEPRRREARPGEAAAASGPGSAAARAARMREIERTPFAHYSDLEYEEASDALAQLARRFRARLGRRLRLARAGRLDFRRTIRASLQRGGALSDLRFRARRPRHIELVVLADVSGSVRYAAALMLRLAAGAHGFFRRVRSFVYVDRLAEADFEGGHLVMTPSLDLYARSDFGRVLAELCARHRHLLTRATVLVILGDGRNNRRPARAGLLREIARRCRAVLWLIPEERGRWGTGDSAIFQYAREVAALVPARNLRELEEALARVA